MWVGKKRRFVDECTDNLMQLESDSNGNCNVITLLQFRRPPFRILTTIVGLRKWPRKNRGWIEWKIYKHTHTVNGLLIDRYQSKVHSMFTSPIIVCASRVIEWVVRFRCRFDANGQLHHTNLLELTRTHVYSIQRYFADLLSALILARRAHAHTLIDLYSPLFMVESKNQRRLISLFCFFFILLLFILLKNYRNNT